MGIININPDSFSGDGTLDIQEAMMRAKNMVSEGADIIDVGGESARTNRSAVSEAEEIRRVQPFLEVWKSTLFHPKDQEQVFPPILSLNTWRPGVMKELLPCGVEMLNDMSGLPNSEPAGLAAKHRTSLLIMHSVGEPKVSHEHVEYRDVVAEVLQFFKGRHQLALQSGCVEDQLIFDPGIDFAKQQVHNLALMRRADDLSALGRPVLWPISRKRIIKETLDRPEHLQRDAGTIGTLLWLAQHGASIFRMHNVKAAYQALRVLEPLMSSSLDRHS